MGIPRPVQWWLHQYLSGALPSDQIPAAVLSWSRFFIHQGAREIVLMESREERVAALERIPASIRLLVEAEVRELWGIRGKL